MTAKRKTKAKRKAKAQRDPKLAPALDRALRARATGADPDAFDNLRALEDKAKPEAIRAEVGAAIAQSYADEARLLPSDPPPPDDPFLVMALQRCPVIARALGKVSAEDAATEALVREALDGLGEIAMALTLAHADRIAIDRERRLRASFAQHQRGLWSLTGRPPKILTRVVVTALARWTWNGELASLRRRLDRNVPDPWPLPTGIREVEPTDAELVIVRSNGSSEKHDWAAVAAVAAKI